MRTVGRFSSLFQGRTDFLGSEEGGCIRLFSTDPGTNPFTTEQMLWIYQGHLTGTRPPIGIYPVVEQYESPAVAGPSYKRFVVKFGAVDIDIQDLPLALNLWKALAALGLPAHLERSRSKGYHVWVFADDWVPAVLMRSALQVACELVHYDPKEIYPKQTELADGSPGNYIRLPYPGALSGMGSVASTRSMLDVGRPEGAVLDLETWVEIAWDTRVSRQQLEQAAALAAPPKPKHRRSVVGSGTPSTEVASLVPKMGGLAHTIWYHGPLEGADRSGTLYKLAHSLREGGFSPDDAFLLVKDADERWGKFSGRADGETRMWEIVERVYEL